MSKITSKDIQRYYSLLREQYKDIPNCQFPGCNNPVDFHEYGGTTCFYHRMLFDFWFFRVIREDILQYKNNDDKRKDFAIWLNNLGKTKRLRKKKQDQIVIEMAQDLINWAC